MELAKKIKDSLVKYRESIKRSCPWLTWSNIKFILEIVAAIATVWALSVAILQYNNYKDVQKQNEKIIRDNLVYELESNLYYFYKIRDQLNKSEIPIKRLSDIYINKAKELNWESNEFRKLLFINESNINQVNSILDYMMDHPSYIRDYFSSFDYSAANDDVFQVLWGQLAAREVVKYNVSYDEIKGFSGAGSSVITEMYSPVQGRSSCSSVKIINNHDDFDGKEYFVDKLIFGQPFPIGFINVNGDKYILHDFVPIENNSDMKVCWIYDWSKKSMSKSDDFEKNNCK